MSFEYQLICPFCQKEVDIFVEVEGFSDYIYDKECESCGKTINKFIKYGVEKDLDLEIMQEVGENLVSRAEYYSDLRNDR